MFFGKAFRSFDRPIASIVFNAYFVGIVLLNKLMKLNPKKDAPSEDDTTENPGPTADVFQLVLLVLAIYAVLALAIDALVKPDPEIRLLIQYVDWVVCLAFFTDFVMKFWRASDKWHYMRTWGWLDLLSSVPMVDELRGTRLIHVLRLLRIIRAIKIISVFVHQKRSQNAIAVTAIACFFLVTLGSIAVLSVERSAGGSIVTAEQALWWAIVTMTTVGYGDVFPVTSAGRMVAVFLMVGGVGLFGVMSGLLASWFVKPSTDTKNQELEALRSDVAQLKALIEKMSADSVRKG